MSLRDDLIHIIDNKAMPSAYALTVIEFKDLSEKELAFVYFTTDHKSPFSVYAWEQRLIEVKNSIFGKTTGVIKDFTAPFVGIYSTKELIEDF